MPCRALNREQRDQNRDSERQTDGIEQRRRDLEPSMALRTEIAGVIMPSPYSRAAPKIPSRRSAPTGRGRMPRAAAATAHQRQNAAFALIVRPHDERQVLHRDDEQRDQKISDSTPRTFSGVGGRRATAEKHSRSAYSGLVPMSPYTTPIAVSVSGKSLRALVAVVAREPQTAGGVS